MLRRIFSMMLISCLIFLTASPVFAAKAEDEGEDTYWPGINFKSISEFEDYLSECHKTGDFKKIGEPYASIGEIYIPKAFERQGDMLVHVAAEFYNYYEIQYKTGSTYYRFFHYYNSASGKYHYNLAKTYYDERAKHKEYLPQKNDMNGYTVYSYYSLDGTTYAWQQDGEYFLLLINKKPGEKYLALCDAKKLPLNIKYTPQHLAAAVRFRDNSDVVIGLGDEISRMVITSPAGLEVTYSSSNPQVAKVDGAGQVEGISAGKTTISATVTQNGKSYKASYNLTVSSISRLYFGVENVVIKAGMKSRFTCGTDPRKQKVSYSSSNTAVATVNEKGEIAALKPGSAIITGECLGLKASYNLNVTPAGSEYNVKEGGYYVSGLPAPMDILLSNPETDYFRYKGSLCVNASGVEAFGHNKLEMFPKGLAGEIKASGYDKTKKDWGASELPVGTKVYFAAVKTKNGEAIHGEFLLVKLGNKYIPYMLGSEG